MWCGALQALAGLVEHAGDVLVFVCLAIVDGQEGWKINLQLNDWGLGFKGGKMGVGRESEDFIP